MQHSELYVGQYIERNDNKIVGIVQNIYAEDAYLTVRTAPYNEIIEVGFEELELWEDGLTDEGVRILLQGREQDGHRG